jgi:hypothetical protein
VKWLLWHAIPRFILRKLGDIDARKERLRLEPGDAVVLFGKKFLLTARDEMTGIVVSSESPALILRA